jgi:hypothetical protein
MATTSKPTTPVRIGPCGNCGRSIDHKAPNGSYPCKAHGGWR